MSQSSENINQEDSMKMLGLVGVFRKIRGNGLKFFFKKV